MANRVCLFSSSPVADCLFVVHRKNGFSSPNYFRGDCIPRKKCSREKQIQEIKSVINRLFYATVFSRIHIAGTAIYMIKIKCHFLFGNFGFLFFPNFKHFRDSWVFSFIQMCLVGE